MPEAAALTADTAVPDEGQPNAMLDVQAVGTRMASKFMEAMKDEPARPEAAYEVKAEKVETKPTEIKPAVETKAEKEVYQTKKAAEWAAVTRARDDAMLQADALAKEIAAIKSKPEQKPDTTELDALRKERDEYEKIVRRHDLANHKPFREHFEGEEKKIMALAKPLVPAEQVAVLEKWLPKPDSEERTAALMELADEIGTFKGSQLGNLVSRLNETRATREEQLEKAANDNREFRETIQRQTAEQQTRAAADADAAFNRTLLANSSKDKGSILFQEREGETEWNKGVKERLAMARAVFDADKLSVDDRAQAAFWAAEGVSARPTLAAAAKEISRLNGELKELKDKIAAAKPSVDGAAKAAAAAPKGFVDTVMAQMRGE